MNMYLVSVVEPALSKRHKPVVSQVVVAAESPAKALEAVKNHYGGAATGWASGSEFFVSRVFSPGETLIL